jgi:hypothetical protein
MDELPTWGSTAKTGPLVPWSVVGYRTLFGTMSRQWNACCRNVQYGDKSSDAFAQAQLCHTRASCSHYGADASKEMHGYVIAGRVMINLFALFPGCRLD